MKRFFNSTRPALLAAVVGLASLSTLAGSAWAQETTPPAAPAAPTEPPAPAPADPSKIDPAARTLIDQMAKAHAAVTSFSAVVNYSVQQGEQPAQLRSAKIAYQKPNKARVTTIDPTLKATVTTVSNGTSLFQTISTDTKGYHKGAAASDAKAIAQVMGAGKAGGIGLFPLLATDPNMGKEILPPTLTSLSHGSDETVGGVLSDIVNASFGPAPDKQIGLSFAIGKTDHLLRRINFAQTLQDGQKVSVTETYTEVQANPALPASTFVFTPAPGMKEIKEAAPAQDAMFDPRLKKGVAPLPFKGNDLDNKPVSLAAYKGKVVLLDFWATWCPPCREEVPNLVKTYNAYHTKGLEVVGVSLDREGDRAKLVSYTKENKMPWRQVYDGKYWQAAMAKAYGVQSIPFSVLIGRDGKILAVGDSLRGESLEPAIKAALAAK